ncbi:SDR family NAD(P)-dependent oxidoreductase [Hyphomicrobium sp.]|uniref:SDR family NAD(P)-dependent oxidoreductase n=1 Tax=Hyphomicrobium sp. TaxID=82 RepID=UPI000FA99DF4|nr:SDR family NAD(P)-dependent oxidoreductase [Hyphomicrobium sp.]RUO99451.1 MAG: SDR family NAD(P)-dependent oxidoreductase [Hyphomicrobium sp.]
MYMDRVGTSVEEEVSSELSQARILITGLTGNSGVDVARSFADLNVRLVVHTADLSPELVELFAFLSQSASEIRLHTLDISTANAAAHFAQTSAQAFGGLDAAINLTSVSSAEIDAIHDDADLEALIEAKLAPLAQLTRVIANRMCVVMSEGLVLNVVNMPEPRDARSSAVAGLVRTALASMIAQESREWANKGIRINGVGPRAFFDGSSSGAYLATEPDIASLALHLASRRGRSFSGHVFDSCGSGF